MTLPDLSELERIELTPEAKGLIGHFANNPLAVVLANAAYLNDLGDGLRHADPAVEADVRAAAGDLREAAEELAQVLRLIGAGQVVKEAAGG